MFIFDSFLVEDCKEQDADTDSRADERRDEFGDCDDVLGLNDASHCCLHIVILASIVREILSAMLLYCPRARSLSPGGVWLRSASSIIASSHCVIVARSRLSFLPVVVVFVRMFHSSSFDLIIRAQ